MYQNTSERIEEAFGAEFDEERYYDNISGVELPRDLVKKARQVEIDWVFLKSAVHTSL